MADNRKTIVVAILFCILFVVIPTFHIIFWDGDVEIIALRLALILGFGGLFYFMVKVAMIGVTKETNDLYYLCLYSATSGPKHIQLDRKTFHAMLIDNPEPYILCYVWFMCRKFARYKNLHLKVGNEDMYVWAQVPFLKHSFWFKNKEFRHYTRLGTFRAFNNDKPYQPTTYKAPYMDTEAELIEVVQNIDANIKSARDIIAL